MKALFILNDPPYGTERCYNALCGACMDARGITEAEIIPGARKSTMDELASATVEADKTLVF